LIPLGSPTPAQRANGFTGSAVGVHGPHRSMRFLGAHVNDFDSTDGCVGLGSDAEMDRIARWMRETGTARIVLQ
jgi:hypothetical protein